MVSSLDAVQAVAEDPIRRNGANPVASLEDTQSFQVTRITLDGPPYYHRRYWDSVILPRLRIFRDAVYEARSNDLWRYSYLQQSCNGNMRLLQALLPYLELTDDD